MERHRNACVSEPSPIVAVVGSLIILLMQQGASQDGMLNIEELAEAGCCSACVVGAKPRCENLGRQRRLLTLCVNLT